MRYSLLAFTIPVITIFYTIYWFIAAFSGNEGDFISLIFLWILAAVSPTLGGGIDDMLVEQEAKKAKEEAEKQAKKAKEEAEKQAKKAAEAAQKAEEERKKELIKKYGEEFGLAVYGKKILVGMNLSMVEDAIGKHEYKDGNDYYFGKPFKRKIVFKKGKLIEDKTFKDRLWLDMPKDMLIASWGNPGDMKESVTKSSVKQRLFFNGRENRQGGTSYEYQVDLENDLVVGWKELE